MSKHLSCSETAKLVRKALAEAFPKIKFSVRSSTYAGGASIDVVWTDGPNTAQVEAVTGKFTGAYFDGMTDFKGSTKALLDGELVRFGADFIFCKREYSDRAVLNAIDVIYAKFLGNFRRDGLEKPQLEDFRRGKLWDMRLSGLHCYGNQNVQAEVFERLGKVSDRLAPNPSNLCARVIYLGNDGYSDVGALEVPA